MRPLNVPEEEIRLAAKTGFLTRRLWEEFFAEGSFSWRCRQWGYFVDRGFFRPHPSALARDVIVLNRKNPMVLRLVGEDVSSPPYVSQLEHDETVAKILLNLKRDGTIHSFDTEMELKKAAQGSQLIRDPADRLKYPDAVIEIGGLGSRLKIALELELTRKDPKRYRQCLNTYATRREIQKVIFIARSNGVFESLKKAMQETYYPDWERPIGFSVLEHWLKVPCKAAIHFSGGETSLERLNSEISA